VPRPSAKHSGRWRTSIDRAAFRFQRFDFDPAGSRGQVGDVGCPFAVRASAVKSRSSVFAAAGRAGSACVVMVPIVTEAEKINRREKAKARRRRRGKKCKPLPSRKQIGPDRWRR